jgi:hypothetical protein
MRDYCVLADKKTVPEGRKRKNLLKEAEATAKTTISKDGVKQEVDAAHQPTAAKDGVTQEKPLLRMWRMRK